MSAVEDIFDLKDEVVLVTGAAGLIGSRFCKVLLEAHASVVAADLNVQKVNDMIEDWGENETRISGIEVDITSSSSVKKLVEQVNIAFGHLDVLVHCAALDPKFDQDHKNDHRVSFEDFPLEMWQQALDVNLTGAFLCVQEAARVMKMQGKGNIILISSIYGLVGPDQRLYQEGSFKPPYYSVSKAGILGLTRYVAAYYANSRIRINALTPGGIYNNHNKDFAEAYSTRSIMGRMADISELDGALLFLASDASSYMTGANLVVDGGWTAW
ncbi:MAG: SDR family oxidoreductase [Chloroflexi bacterium]|nr:SDR family oxidoreductase [Chloroflexota bacterium]